MFPSVRVGQGEGVVARRRVNGAEWRKMIRAITAKEALAVRHPVLRPGRPAEDAVFGCDAEAATRHFGAFDERGELVGVVTIHPAAFVPAAGMGGVAEEGAWQLRGMATLPAVRGAGYGAALVRHVHGVVRREAGAGLIWCNARVKAVSFYARLGWEVVGEEFDIPTVGPHFRMLRRV